MQLNKTRWITVSLVPMLLTFLFIPLHFPVSMSPLNQAATPTNPLPRAVTVTPDSPSASTEQGQGLLDRAVNASLASRSLKFAFNGEMTVEVRNERGKIKIQGNGHAMNLSDPRTLALQVSMTLTIEIDGQRRELIIEERIIDGVLYIRGEEAATNRKTRWIGVRLTSVIDDFFRSFEKLVPGLSRLNPLSSGTMSADQAQEIADLLKLLSLGSFVRTRRVDSTADAVQFATTIDIRSLFESKKDLTVLLTILARLGALKISPSQIEKVVPAFQLLLPRLLPKLDLTIDTYVDPTSERVKRVVLDFDMTLNSMTSLLSRPTRINVHLVGVLSISGYDNEYKVETPADVVMVKSLDDLSSADVMITPEPPKR